MRSQRRRKPETRNDGRIVRVAVYCRISTDETRQPYSLPAQRERCEAACGARDGWVVVAHYTDEASGATIDRPGLQQALQDAAAGKFELLLFYRLDRFSRKLYDLLALILQLSEANVAISSVTEPIDTSTPVGRAMVQMLGTFAELEREMIRDRISHGVAQRAKSGKWTGALPMGMIYDENGTPSADDRWLPLTERIFEMYVDDRLGTPTIAHVLNDEGLRTPDGAKWSGPKIVRILRSAAYVSIVRYNGTEYPALHDPVISRERWQAAQELLAERALAPEKRRSNTSDFVLSGLTRCRRCQWAYVGTSGNGRGGHYRYYQCQGRGKYGRSHCENTAIPADRLEEAVLDQLAGVLADTPILEEAWEKAQETAARTTPNRRRELGQIENALASLRQKLLKYAEAFETGELTAGILQDRLEALELKRTALLQRRAQISARTYEPEPFPADAIETIRSILAASPGEPTDNARKKALLALVVKEIQIDGTTVRCTYRLPRDGEVRAPTGKVELSGFEPLLVGESQRRRPGSRAGAPVGTGHSGTARTRGRALLT
jgi:site-specific DNA recombinase